VLRQAPGPGARRLQRNSKGTGPAALRTRATPIANPRARGGVYAHRLKDIVPAQVAEPDRPTHHAQFGVVGADFRLRLEQLRGKGDQGAKFRPTQPAMYQPVPVHAIASAA
jgi:hypothetical protein